MNKGMVDAFSAKQVLIQNKKLLPEINFYQIALGYGTRDNFNSFMAQIESEILPAREAWTKITGIQHSPEIVFAIAGLIPRILGTKSIVSSLLNEHQNFRDKADQNKFQDLFNDHFSPIDLTPQAQQEIAAIDTLLR